MKKINTIEILDSKKMEMVKGGKRTATVSYTSATLIMITHPFMAKIVGTSSDGICIEW